MVEQQFASGKSTDQHTFSDDRYGIDLQIFADDDEGCFHKKGGQSSVVSGQLHLVVESNFESFIAIGKNN